MSIIADVHTPGVLEKNSTNENLLNFVSGPKLPESTGARIFFASGGDLIEKGSKATLKEDDVWALDYENTCDHIWNKLMPLYEAELKKPKPSLFRAILGVVKGQFVGAITLMILYGCLSFVNPVILPFLITYINDYTFPAYAGYIYIFCIILAQVVGSVFFYYGQFRANISGMNMRTAMLQLVYRKALTIAPAKDSSSGKLVNLVSGDALFIADTISIVSNGIAVPIQIIIGFVLLAIYTKYFVVIVVGMMILALVITSKLGQQLGMRRIGAQQFGDKRLKVINELLSGIRIIKYYAWEEAFYHNIDKFREDELKALRALNQSRMTLITLINGSMIIASALTIILFSLYGELNQAFAFTLLSIFSLLRQSFVALPVTMSFIPQYIRSFQRVQQFLSSPDIKAVDQLETKDAQIHLKDASFQWPGTTEPFLKDINFKAKKGDLITIVGPVGSGKSSFIQALLGELPKISGEVAIGGSVAYVAQEAFIVNSTVRENIIFGKPFDMKKYRAVLEASALIPDLHQFTAGDSTEIGERGVNLSGGQKQRISIARALYSDADIILLDDPLSAVDSHVGKHLFEQAIQKYWANKIVILSTNQLQYLPYAAKVIFLNNGEVVADGTFTELLASSSMFKEQMEKYGVGGQKKEDEKEEKTAEKEAKPVEKAVETQKSGTLINNENKKSGLIGWNVYWYYFKKGNAAVFILIVLFLLISVFSRVVGTWWLTQWTIDTYSLTPAIYAGVFAAFNGGELLFSIMGFFTDIHHSIQASRSLHSGLLRKCLRAPTAFYDVTPLGRVVNRFSKELDFVDQLLPLQLLIYVNAIANMLGVFVSLILGSIYMIIVVVVVMVGYYFFNLYYRKTYIEIQRLEALSRAPIFSLLGETIRGATTIRAYKMQDVFKNVNKYSIDQNSRHRYAQKFILAWYGFRLDLIGNGIILILFILIVSLRVVQSSALGSFAALALSSTSGFTALLSNLSVSAAETEARINSVERIREYDTLEQEAPAIIPENRPPKDWPATGEIVFKDTSLRYRQGDLVLKRLNLTVNGEEKVGIVGRTGAGKSTLLQALFRIVELAEGSIEIDGVDISTIGLQDLRSKISIIPQDPVLFMGTVRYNIDPFGEHSDADLWEALAMVNLKNHIESLEGQLEHRVEENGSNFSVGQRQLICMARALLRKTKILVMDEATASVDLDTDMLIQSMVRKNFSDRTTLTIAHRLNTVMDSTKVLVLNRGELAEYDKPAVLLEDSKGIFSSMVDATGKEQSEHLRKIARGEIGVVQSLQSLASESAVDEESISEELVKAFAKSKKNKNK
eukprot:TRINITY_DN133_c1_g2_i1.p1 TRINITY_DN133_c1_g2~~TRINITY_DN133_c1_g2_i1.p1  ORF type:complete len:1304 (-),score=377.00 TRINITY_DN133_c1_g2_i1:6-3917(-)